MKRFLKVLVVLLLLLLVLPVSNLLLGMPESSLAKVKTDDPAFAAALAVMGTKCVNCHTDDYSLPFYASLPGARSLVEDDIRKGTRWMDLKAALLPESGPVGEVALAKIEHVLDAGTMPPHRYLMLHWNGFVGADDKEAVREWIRETRLANYATGTAAKEHAADVIQPLPDRVDLDVDRIELGRQLFHDPRLSGDDSVSCSSCHALERGGTDRERFSTGVGGARGDINSPTVFNAGFQFRQFWDGRAANLEEQADGPVNNPVEMSSSWAEAIPKLAKDEDFVRDFTASYPEGLTKENLLDAIATFERSLVTPNSPVDRYLKGDDSALSEDAKAGLERFRALGCAACHAGRLLGGRSFEVMGRAADYFAKRGNEGKPDQGRLNVTGLGEDRHRFKVPTLRNVEVTGPWFHDGSAVDLPSAVRTMARVQLDEKLGVGETEEIVAFLKGLTGEYGGRPLR
jgi:cytochrome c peroxidase